MGLIDVLISMFREDVRDRERRRVCPLCRKRRFAQLDRHSWRTLKLDGEAVHGTSTIVRCLGCQTTLFEELDTAPMTEEQRGEWLRRKLGVDG